MTALLWCPAYRSAALADFHLQAGVVPYASVALVGALSAVEGVGTEAAFKNVVAPHAEDAVTAGVAFEVVTSPAAGRDNQTRYRRLPSRR